MKRIASVLLSLLLSLMAVSCLEQADGGAVASYSGEIRASDPITFTLSDEFAIKDLQKAEQFLRKNIKITPQVPFDVLVTDSRTVVVTPMEALAYNTYYKLTANFAKAAGCGGQKSVCRLHTLAPVVAYNFGQLKVDPKKPDVYSLTAEITSKDPLEDKYLEKGFSVRGVSCRSEWQHSIDGCGHILYLTGIAAGKTAEVLEISYDLPEYASSGVRSYTVPREGVFSVMDSQVTLEPYGFKIAFSALLDESQDFSTLVTVPEGGRLSFIADDNILRISPAIQAQDHQFVYISKSLKSASGASLDEDFEGCFAIPSGEPSIGFLAGGSIIPSTVSTDLAFQSINYAKARVRVKRIYENNVLQFLQSNRLSDKYCYTDNVARVVADTTFALAQSSSPKLRDVAVYGINLGKIVKVQKGAIYRVEIRGVDPLAAFNDQRWESDYYFGSYSDYASRVLNILVSDIGLIAKGSDSGEYSIFAVNLMSAEPLNGAAVTVYNDVNQVIAEGSTASGGRFSFKTADRPKTAVVSSGSDRSYLNMDGATAISLSNFDVAGSAVSGGQKGFIFGERGVWRPGDDIHITFISMLESGVLPDNHPATAVLKNPQGQTMSTLVSTEGHSGMYSFCFSTDASAPTGNWEVEITSGGETFSKTVRIETVKPNNILINLSLPQGKAIPSSAVSGSISAKWLVGSPAAGLETRVEVALSKGSTSFKNFKDYVFEDASRIFTSETKEIFKGTTSASGSASFNVAVASGGKAPGLLNAVFTTRVFEKGGDLSIDRCSAVISPYNTYIGISAPQLTNDWGEKYIDRSRINTFSLAAVDRSGNPVGKDVEVEVEVYKMGWSWWWSSSAENLASYSKDSFNEPYKVERHTIKGGSGAFRLDLTGEQSGFYLVRVTDLAGGHAASLVAMALSDGEHSSDGNADSAVRLPISLDKEKYCTGETAKVSIASAAGAKALVSIEKGRRVLNSYWISCSGTTTEIPVKIEEGMAPNIYVGVTLVQPYDRTANDAPVRMFGVRRIEVDDPSSHLAPVIDIAPQIKPESELTFSVRESSGKPMSYVVALVDEGLLSLTRYKTPDPWGSFYATEALGVRTWDLYNLVLGAYGARMEQLFAIGGDGEGSDLITPDSHAERFKPVSLFLGPFSLKAKASQKHTVTVPQYIGTLRAMVIATDGTRMGSCEAPVSVTQPVMVKATLPRVMATDESVEMPVTVFATKDGLGDVTVEVSSEGGLAVEGPAKATVKAPKAGEYMAYFKLKASSSAGAARVRTAAVCGSDRASDVIEMDIRDSNPVTTSSMAAFVEGGASKGVTYAMAGSPAAGSVRIEASTIPPVDIDFRLGYLTSYPHGCLEQITSAAFPQLYLGSLMELDKAAASRAESGVKSVISRMSSYAIASGGMTYWPGTASSSGAHVWATVYATHFLVEARRCGYAVPGALLNANLKYLGTVAAGGSFSSVARCYACYVLALSGMSARSQMNRLREAQGELPADCAWYLAAAYAADGKKDVARKIVESLGSGPASAGGSSAQYNPMSDSFDSEERTLALASSVYVALSDKAQAFKCVQKLSAALSDRSRYMSTQSTAWALKAVADYQKICGSGGIDLSVKTSAGDVALRSEQPFACGTLDVPKGQQISLKLSNSAKSPVYVVISSKGIPEKGAEEEKACGLKIVSVFTDSDGNAVDPSSLAQGTDFYVTTYVSNLSATVDYTNLALVQIFPSGWEIHAERSSEFYRDVRDDRVNSYFNLGRSSTFKVRTRLTATYKGRFYLPSAVCEAMYDASVCASTAGGWCTVR